jgi:hypothetical protein
VIAMWVMWFLAIYGLSAILIDLCKRWNAFGQQFQELKVQMLVYNSETNLEGAVRSIVSVSRLEGRPVHLTVYDFGSTDNTAKILEHLETYYPYLLQQVTVVSQEEVQKTDHTIDLRQGFCPAEIA